VRQIEKPFRAAWAWECSAALVEAYSALRRGGLDYSVRPFPARAAGICFACHPEADFGGKMVRRLSWNAPPGIGKRGFKCGADQGVPCKAAAPAGDRWGGGSDLPGGFRGPEPAAGAKEERNLAVAT